jgi:hypothetical protein
VIFLIKHGKKDGGLSKGHVERNILPMDSFSSSSLVGS